MQNRTTLARPYARAAYAAAKNLGQVAEWSQALQVAAMATENDVVQSMIGNPRFTSQAVVERLMAIGGSYFGESFGHLLSVLAHYDRLALLPEVSQQYERYRRDAEDVVYVQITSAEPVSDEQSQALSDRLKKRFGRDIELDVDVDAALIGGAIIRAGDEVIDGSVRGRLERMRREIAS